VDGDLLSNPTSWDINGGGAGGATFHSPFSRENLTDTSFSYSGIDIEINFDPSSPNEDKFICGLPPCIFNLMEWSSSAENVQIVASIPESVTIDIKPGSDPNSINLRSKGVIPVAILSTNTAVGEALDFDAMQVDFSTVTFGPNGAVESHGQGHVEDVDGDGDPDMVFHFKTQETGIACGDTDATLTGGITGGPQFTGTDTVKTVGCNVSKQDTSVKGVGAMSWIFLLGLSVLGLWRRDR